MDKLKIKPGTYVVAVSGGVDSVVLLHQLSNQSKLKLVVAHFDHEIRPDSEDDRRFVQALAKRQGVSFEYEEGKLGSKVSEADARQKRYDFLERVRKKYRADAIVTAHHQDDVIETAIINILRGTYRKGLSSLRSNRAVVRPLLSSTKQQLYDYARHHKLKWHEDPTNTDTQYLRNYIRQILVPRLEKADPAWRASFLKRIERGAKLNIEIDRLVNALHYEYAQPIKTGWSIERQHLLTLPQSLANELLLRLLKKGNQSANLSAKLIKHAWLFSKTAREGAHLQLSEDIELAIDKGNVLVMTKTLL